MTQPKLAVGETNVADQAMRMPAPGVSISTAPASIARALDRGGQPLDSVTRKFMESRFSFDFGRVRVHTGEDAAASTREIGATAYTVGSDVVFGKGGYAPSTEEGKQLLAHELAHVVQQSGGGSVPPPMTPGAAHEADATRAAAAAVGGGVPVRVSAATGVGLARNNDPKMKKVDPEANKAVEVLKEREGPSEPGPPAAQDALTPDELIDDHVFGPRVHEEVGDLRRRLANREARLKADPTNPALQKEVRDMGARLRALDVSGFDPSARGANVPGVGSINTRAAIQVVGPDGEMIALERGRWSPSQHAEGDALGKLRSRLGPTKLPPGTRIMVAGNQVVCTSICKPDIARFAKDYGVPLENISASIKTRPKIVGQGPASGKTTERTGLRADVPEATVKTEPLFPGGKEPPPRTTSLEPATTSGLSGASVAASGVRAGRASGWGANSAEAARAIAGMEAEAARSAAFTERLGVYLKAYFAYQTFDAYLDAVDTAMKVFETGSALPKPMRSAQELLKQATDTRDHAWSFSRPSHDVIVQLYVNENAAALSKIAATCGGFWTQQQAIIKSLRALSADIRNHAREMRKEGFELLVRSVTTTGRKETASSYVEMMTGDAAKSIGNILDQAADEYWEAARRTANTADDANAIANICNDMLLAGFHVLTPRCTFFHEECEEEQQMLDRAREAGRALLGPGP
jgi:hypothetical protein